MTSMFEQAPAQPATAGDILLAALTARGLAVLHDTLGYAVALHPATPLQRTREFLHLAVADGSPSVDRTPAAHTGWTVVLHDKGGDCIAQLYDGRRDGVAVDCAADSQAAADLIGTWVASRGAVELFTVDGGGRGPYPAAPTPAGWSPYEPILVTRETARQIARDLNEKDTGCGLSAEWNGADLVFAWDARYREDHGTQTVTPDRDDFYLIGGLWPWMRWQRPSDRGETSGRSAAAAAEAAGQDTPDVLAALAHLRGRFAWGYGSDEISTVFGAIHEEGGPILVCVWDYADAYGYGGDSRFYAEGEDGTHFEIQPDVHQWLSGQLDTPGPVDTWVCAPVEEQVQFPGADGFYNYARVEREG